MIKVNAFSGRDNPEEFSVKQGRENFDPIAFGVTKTEVTAGGETISSEDGAVFWVGNKINILFGRLNLPPKFYNAQVIVYSDLYPNGVVIAGTGKQAEIALSMQA